MLRQWALRSTATKLPAYLYLVYLLGTVALASMLHWRGSDTFDGFAVGWLAAMSGMWLQGDALRAVIDEQARELASASSKPQMEPARRLSIPAQMLVFAFTILLFVALRVVHFSSPR
jgi:hypothetical protein